jgi:hypothetical protein
MRKTFLLLTSFVVFLGLYSFSQDSTFIIPKGQIKKFRNGYIITPANDTLRGLIWINADDSICFIRVGTRVKSPLIGNCSDLPFITASEGRIKSLYRNGLFYEIHNTPPCDFATYLNVVVKGKLSLFILINHYEDARSAEAYSIFGGITGVMIGALASASDKPEDEYYDLKAYYIQKDNAEPLIMIPPGEKKFRAAFYPLIKDNPEFLKRIIGNPFDYDHLRSLVQLYNSTAERK